MATEFGLSVALEEMCSQNEQALAAGDALDQKGNFIFAGLSLILGLMAALEVAQDNEPSCRWVHIGLIVAGIVLYVGGTGVFLWVASPRRYRSALEADLDVIRVEILERDPIKAMLSLIDGYVQTIAHNRSVNKRKVIGVRICGGLLLVMMLAALGFAFLTT